MARPSRTGDLRRDRKLLVRRIGRTRQQCAVQLVALVALATAVAMVNTAVVIGAPSARLSGVGRRSRQGMSNTLWCLPEADFRLLFRMSRLDIYALLDLVRSRLETDEVMVVLATGEPIPADFRLALALRFLAGRCYLDCMLAFGVGRCTLFHIFHPVC